MTPGWRRDGTPLSVGGGNSIMHPPAVYLSSVDVFVVCCLSATSSLWVWGSVHGTFVCVEYCHRPGTNWAGGGLNTSKTFTHKLPADQWAFGS